MTVIRGATISDWWNTGLIKEVVADPAGNGATDVITVNSLSSANSNASVFNATSRDAYVTPGNPDSKPDVIVTDPDSPNQVVFSTDGPFGIGVYTAAVVGKPGITTPPEELGYYRQITTADKSDKLTIKFNREFATNATPGDDSGIVFSYFYSGETSTTPSTTGEIAEYQLFNDGVATTGIIRILAQNTGVFDWQNIPEATNPGVFQYKFSTQIPTPVRFDEIRLTAGNGEITDGTDFIIEGIIASDQGPADPQEDPDPIDTLLDIKPGSNPSAFNIGSNGVLPVAILGSDDLLVSDININRDTIRLGFDESLLPGSGVSYSSSHTPSQSDVNGDGYTDLVLHFSMSAIKGIKSQLPANVNRNDAPMFVYFETSDGTAYMGANPDNDPVKINGL